MQSGGHQGGMVGQPQNSVGQGGQYNPAAAAAAAAAAVAAQSVTGYSIQTMDTRPAVVQVANFPEQIANPDALFTLFGVYGDILKVKIMYNRRDNALMQFKSYEQALNAVSKMDKVKLFEKTISVGISKFPEIQIPVKNDGGLAKDYSTSPLHRFKKPGSKNFFNIFTPNQSLHLSNISPNTTQENLQELFSKHGVVKNFKWISKEGNKMAIIEMTCLEESVLALIALHNFQLNGSYLRVNFAK
jgi:hnRNP-L/PTB/hephaestus splicing factor